MILVLCAPLAFIHLKEGRSFFEVFMHNKEVKPLTRFCLFSWLGFSLVAVVLFLISYTVLKKFMQISPSDFFVPRIITMVLLNAFIFLLILPNMYTASSPRPTPWIIIKFFQGKKEKPSMQSYIMAMLAWLPLFCFFCLLYGIFDFLILQYPLKTLSIG